MNDLVMLEASLFQLRTAIASIEDETMLPQLELTVSVLARAVAAAREALNAARVSDIEFALNDVAGVADSLSSDDAAAIAARCARSSRRGRARSSGRHSSKAATPRRCRIRRKSSRATRARFGRGSRRGDSRRRHWMRFSATPRSCGFTGSSR